MYALEITRFAVQRILVPILTAIGLVGNAISICVLTHKSMVSSTDCYLTALAVFDTLYIISSFTLSLRHYPAVDETILYQLWYPFGKALTDACSNVSVSLTVTFSLERLVAVYYPMKGRVLCTPKRAKLIASLVSAFAIMCTVPEFLEVKVVAVTERNTTVYTIVDTEMANTVAYKLGYVNFVMFMFTIIPTGLLFTCNGLLLKTVYRATRIRRSMTRIPTRQNNRRQNEQNRITLMLVGVVVVFLICQFPNAGLMLYWTYIRCYSLNMTTYQHNAVRIAGNVVNLLILVNSSMNFMLYSAMSTKFRRVFMRTFCYCDRNGIDNFSKTELSFYKGKSMRGSEIPFRFRSHRATKGTKEEGVQTYQHRTRRNNNTCNRYHLTYKKRTFVPEHKGSLSISSSPKDSSRNNQYSPIILRRAKCKHNGNGTNRAVRVECPFLDADISEEQTLVSSKDATPMTYDDMYTIKLTVKRHRGDLCDSQL
ncbi:sex peptide receptor-related protein 2-like [Dreissena polymorpha]|nr:sex peptide receptor-related protein 2-like [Dreissena polymorpha]